MNKPDKEQRGGNLVLSDLGVGARTMTGAMQYRGGRKR